MTKTKTFAVTGYGSFGCHSVNPSQLVVENLGNLQIDGIQLSTEIISVAYGKAFSCSERLCKTQRPDFIIHIGVHGEIEDEIRLEQCSFSHGYWHCDVEGKVPLLNRPPTEVNNDELKILKSQLDCERLAEEANVASPHPELVIAKSEDPGRYLCGYIYYSSLALSDGRALFIHVPPLSDVATVPNLTAVVVDVIQRIAKDI